MNQPAAWMFTNPKNGNVVFFSKAAEAEKFSEWNSDWDMDTLYAEPKRKWVGLTDEEIHEIRLNTLDGVATNYEAYRAIETKLKEKNT